MLFNYIFIAIVLISPVTLSANKNPGEKKYDKNYFRENEIIVNYRKGIERGRIEEITREMKTEIVYRSYYARFITVRFGKHEIMRELIKLFEQYPEITFAEPNAIAHILWTPNDPHFQYQWNFDATHINMPLAWDIERGGDSSVVVSILDTGIAYEDYLIPSYEVDSVSSQDGYYHQSPDLSMTNFVNGYDEINDDTHPNDMHGHGTHVCGTIAQSTNNAKGVAGMAFNVSIMPVRVLNSVGSGPCDRISDGIYYAYQNGADVLSMSLGGAPGDSNGFGTVHQAIIDATNAGAIVVAATGNSGDGELSYPAGFPECIAVGATDIDKGLAHYSQWGDGIDVVAPGGDLNDTIPGTSFAAGILQSTFYDLNNGSNLATVDSFCYMFLQGTSMATPHVSALAALLISHGITDPSAVKQAIYSTCTDLGSPGYDTCFGYGLINPPIALGADPLFTSLPILQNPYSPQFIDIWVVAERPLVNDLPDTCLVSLGGTETYLNFEKVDVQTYRSDFFFNESGTASLYVSARDSSSTRGIITRQFSISEVPGKQGGDAESADKEFRISIPEDTYSHSYWIVITDEQPGIDESIPYSEITGIYHCGPEGNSIHSNAVIRFKFDTSILSDVNLSDIGIYRKRGSTPEYVKTEIDSGNGYAYATVNEFGTFVLMHWKGTSMSKAIGMHTLSLNCYPVPVSKKVFFSYVVPFTASIDIGLYDVSGRKIATIERNSLKTYGVYTGSCKLTDMPLSSGVYFLKVVARNSKSVLENSKKIIFVR